MVQNTVLDINIVDHFLCLFSAILQEPGQVVNFNKASKSLLKIPAHYSLMNMQSGFYSAIARQPQL